MKKLIAITTLLFAFIPTVASAAPAYEPGPIPLSISEPQPLVAQPADVDPIPPLSVQPAEADPIPPM